ncbi:MAG: hypothetical protein OXM55_03525 [Bdellovibrionales bacterium]|nr:hypothetical protein [Bdellovibrionales bacterium]
MASSLKHIYGHQVLLSKLLKANKDRHLPHALLFSGPDGIGKKKVALALVQTLLCEKSYPACGECDDCINVEQENSHHILLVQPDGLYIKSEAIRQISKFVSLQSFAPARAIIIDPADRMNLSSANSLLKILEEPPLHVYFILISSHLLALPVTIRSRVQILRFQPLNSEDLYTIVKKEQRENKELKESGKKKKNKTDKKKEKKTLFSPLENHWMIRASHGSMNNLEKWQENKDLRDQALKLLKESITGQELFAFGALADLVKDREQALFVCLFWQQILRDACLMKFSNKNIIHQDQREILSVLTKVPFENLNVFFQNVVQLEQGLKGYLDSSLNFDSLFIQIREKLKVKNKNT